jgi:hypothetical protein
MSDEYEKLKAAIVNEVRTHDRYRKLIEQLVISEPPRKVLDGQMMTELRDSDKMLTAARAAAREALDHYYKSRQSRG